MAEAMTHKNARPVLEGLWIDSMAALQRELLKVLHINPAQVRPAYFAEDLRQALLQMPEPPQELLWKDHWLSCRKMRFTLVPVTIGYISLGPGHSNMMRDAVNTKADMQAAEHWKASQEPLEKLLKEIDILFEQSGLQVTYG